MDATPISNQVLAAAVLRLFRPLVRVLLRHGIAFGAFETLAKQAYVDVALADFGLPGKRPSLSRVSILTGLTRKDVQRWARGEAEAAEALASERYNRAARVLAGWIRDARFHDAHGTPLPLPIDGDPGFSQETELKTVAFMRSPPRGSIGSQGRRHGA
jgi:hypothetical protein